MRVYLAVLLVLAGCATPLTPQQQAARLIGAYGPVCDQLGFDRATDGWRNCILKHYDAEIQRDASNAAASAAAYQAFQATRPRTCTFYGAHMTCY